MNRLLVQLRIALGFKDFRDSDLSGLDLTGIDLRDCRLAGANLQGTVLKGARLDGLDLSGCSLLRADLRGASLRECDFDRATLKACRLDGADLFAADLRKRDMRGASLFGANLSGANLSDAQLQGVDMRRCDLSEATVWGAKMDRARLMSANLSDASMDDVSLLGADLRRANLTGTALCEAKLEGAKLWDAMIDGTKLGGAELRGAKIDLGLLPAREAAKFRGIDRADDPQRGKRTPPAAEHSRGQDDRADGLRRADRLAEQVESAERPADETVERTYLEVPYAEHKAARAAGARFDRQRRAWYIPGRELTPEQAKWQPQTNPTQPRAKRRVNAAELSQNGTKNLDDLDLSGVSFREFLRHEFEAIVQEWRARRQEPELAAGIGSSSDANRGKTSETRQQAKRDTKANHSQPRPEAQRPDNRRGRARQIDDEPELCQ